jgi:serralysin
MAGGSESDTYYVDNVGDVVEEASGSDGGYGRVYSSSTLTVGAFLESLYLVGRAAIGGSGIWVLRRMSMRCVDGAGPAPSRPRP